MTDTAKPTPAGSYDIAARLLEIERATGQPPSEGVRRIIEGAAAAHKIIAAGIDVDAESRAAILAAVSSVRQSEKAAFDLAEREARAMARSRPEPAANLSALRGVKGGKL